MQAITEIETRFGKKFANVKDPLLVSVRSRVAVSMLGMMDTILHVGSTTKFARDFLKKPATLVLPEIPTDDSYKCTVMLHRA